MRLWHENIINKLPREQLLGQHRECCALRGNGWNKKHSVVDYVFLYSPMSLFNYHMKIMEEMESRGYKVDHLWKDRFYRGKKCTSWENMDGIIVESYPEHNDEYMKECKENLLQKGIII